MRRFVCDAPGCKSNCTLSPAHTEDDPTPELERRGWGVKKPDSQDETPGVMQFFCQTHLDLAE